MALEQFAQYGVIGLVLFWFMWRNEAVITRLTTAVDNNTLALVKLARKKN